MADTPFKNFGDLYRAAFAELDAKKKTILLSQVQKALWDWEESSFQSPAQGNLPTPPISLQSNTR
jgi:hypothetical protein